MENETVGIEMEVGSFREGDFAGFKFSFPRFANLDAACTHYGQDIVLGLLNTMVSARIRTKVKNDLPKDKTGQALLDFKAQLLSESGGVLFSETQAMAWKPSSGDLESPNKLFKEAQKALQEGDLKRGMELLTKSAEAAKRKYGVEE